MIVELSARVLELSARVTQLKARVSKNSQNSSTVLSYSEDGRNRTVMLASDQVDPVRAAVDRYRAAQAKLEVAGKTGLAVAGKTGLAGLLTRGAARRSR